MTVAEVRLRAAESVSVWATLSERVLATRALTLALTDSLCAEDMAVQSMDDASPTKWHLAHTSWAFEELLLAPFATGYRRFDERYGALFNSYYEHFGWRQPRARRGLLTRPMLEEILHYRRHVDQALSAFLDRDESAQPLVASRLELCLNHEQQHQELMLTDILSLFAANPLRPAYSPHRGERSSPAPQALGWIEIAGGRQSFGHDGEGFAFDHEGPRHDALVRPFALGDRLVTNGEWRAFMDAGGYETPTLWLSDGWGFIRGGDISAPLYWESCDGDWRAMTLRGMEPITPAAPVCHISYYEADAFARWRGARLPTEYEWEAAAALAVGDANDLATGVLTPRPACGGGGLRQMFGDVWEWTASAFLPYPGYQSPSGPLAEYNSKFMVGQHVLRGGSCVTPRGHARASYRNFFYPHQRWQFCGLRLAKDIR